MRRIIPSVFILLIFVSASAQNYKLNQRYPGYFINAKGDSIHGYILLTNKLDNQKIGEYSNDSRGEKIKIHLLPDEVKGFKVQDRIYTAEDFGDPDPLNQHFLLTLAEGELHLYQYFWLSKDLYINEGNGQRPADGNDEEYLQSEFLIVDKTGKKFVIPNEGALTKNAEEIFKNNHDLTEKIKSREKEFKYNDLPAIVNSYNESVSH